MSHRVGLIALQFLFTLLCPAQALATGIPLSDGSSGMTCYYYAAGALLAWRTPGGDWTGREKRGMGDSPYAVERISKTNAPQRVVIDVTPLAREWASGLQPAGAVFLRSVDRVGIVNFSSREHLDSVAHPQLVLEWDDGEKSRLSASADAHFSCPTHRSLGRAKTLQVGDGYSAVLVFPFVAREGRKISSASLVLFSDRQYGRGASIGVFRPDPPSMTQDHVRKGYAQAYVDDVGIENHPATVYATDFESPGWRRAWSDVDPNGDTELVADDARNSFETLVGKALRVTVERGQRQGASMHLRLASHAGAEPEELYFRYYLRLGENWNPVVSGGKLPGLAGTYERAGWGGRKADGENGWSARGAFFQFNPRDAEFSHLRGIGTYLYHADGDTRYGDQFGWNLGPTSLLEKNRWYSIEQYVKMNRPGERDGILRTWVDGRLAFNKEDIRYRDVSELKIESVWLNVYHGGMAKASEDLALYIDNLVVAHEYIGPLGQKQ